MLVRLNMFPLNGHLHATRITLGQEGESLSGELRAVARW